MSANSNSKDQLEQTKNNQNPYFPTKHSLDLIKFIYILHILIGCTNIHHVLNQIFSELFCQSTLFILESFFSKYNKFTIFVNFWFIFFFASYKHFFFIFCFSISLIIYFSYIITASVINYSKDFYLFIKKNSAQ